MAVAALLKSLSILDGREALDHVCVLPVFVLLVVLVVVEADIGSVARRIK